jgi:hypothetical protein
VSLLSQTKPAINVPDLSSLPGLHVENQAEDWPEEIRREKSPWRGPVGSAFFALFLIVACATVPVEKADTSVEPAPPPLEPLFGFLASAAVNEVGVVKDPRTGQSVRVTAGRAYQAASGRLCRRFEVMAPLLYEGMTDGLACKDAEGLWTKSKLLINPDDLDAPRLQLP